MRLAIIRRRFDPHGGAERFILTAAGALRESGEDVTIIAEDWAGAAAAGFDVRTLARRGFTRAARQRHFQSEVAALLAQGGFDLVQSHERVRGADIFRAGDGVHAAWVARLAHARGPLGALALRFDALHRLVIATERQMAADPRTLFVANSDLVAGELRDWLGVPDDRLTVIENGVDLARFRPPAADERTAARQGLGLPDQAPVIAFVGSGFERKGAFALVDALRLPELRGVHAVIAGRDRKAADLTRRIERFGLAGRVRLLGGVDDPRDVYRAADVFALPSLYDPLPNAAIEAIATGLPVVTTADTGVAAPVAAAGAGLVASRDAGDLAAALSAALGDRQTLSAAALRLAPRYDLAAATLRWQALYRDVAAGRQR